MGKSESFQIIVSVVLFAANVVTAVRTLDWESNRCHSESPYQTGTFCSDYDAAIACLEKAGKLPSLDAIDRNEIDYSLNFYRDIKQREENCPTLKARGSCLDEEMMHCMNRTGDCDGWAFTLGCLVDLNATCSNAPVLTQIGRMETEVDRCERGVYKCHDEIRGCVQEWGHLRNSGNRDEACKEVAVAEKCLDDLKCEYLYQFKFSVTFVIKDYKTQCPSYETTTFSNAR